MLVTVSSNMQRDIQSTHRLNYRSRSSSDGSLFGADEMLVALTNLSGEEFHFRKLQQIYLCVVRASTDLASGWGTLTCGMYPTIFPGIS